MNHPTRRPGDRTRTVVAWLLGVVALVVLGVVFATGLADGRAGDAGECEPGESGSCLIAVEGEADLVRTRKGSWTYRIGDLDVRLDRGDRRELDIETGSRVTVLTHDGRPVVVETSAGQVELGTRGYGQAGLAAIGIGSVLVLMASALLPGSGRRKVNATAEAVTGLYLVGGVLVLAGVPLPGALGAGAGGGLLGALIGWSYVPQSRARRVVDPDDEGRGVSR